MNDVFDEDLMRELGLDPDDIAAVKTPQKKTPPSPPARPTVPVQPQAVKPAPPVVQPAAPTKQPAPVAAKVPEAPHEPVPAPKVEVEPEAYGEKMTQNIPVHLAAVIAKKTIALKDVIEMRTGEVIDFKKQPQDPIDLVVNGKLVAKAELVLVDGRVGARIVKLVR